MNRGRRRRRGGGKGSQYERKTRSAFKQGYLDSCTPMDPNVVTNLSMNDTYVDVYAGLKPWERFGAVGWYSLEKNMCTIDRMNLQKGIDKLKNSTDVRTISITNEKKEPTLTSEVLKMKKEAMKKRKSKEKGKKSTKRRSPSRRLHKQPLSERELEIREKELIGRFHTLSTGKTLGEHAPIPSHQLIGANVLKNFQHQNIVSFPSHSKIETFVFKAKKCWNSQWIGKNFISFLMVQSKCVNLPLHGISANFSGTTQDVEESFSIYLKMAIAYKIDQHGRYLPV